jgi:hypothetical protein
MIRTFLAFLFCCFAFAAQPDPNINGSFIGISGGTNQTMSIDIGLKMFDAGYTSWGVHVSSDSRQKNPDAISSNYEPNKALWGTQQTYETKSDGWSAGAYMNVGRAFVAGGMSWINQSVQQKQVLNDGTTQLNQNLTNTLLKPYIKVGYIMGHLAIYGGYSQHYGATAGLGFSF